MDTQKGQAAVTLAVGAILKPSPNHKAQQE